MAKRIEIYIKPINDFNEVCDYLNDTAPEEMFHSIDESNEKSGKIVIYVDGVIYDEEYALDWIEGKTDSMNIKIVNKIINYVENNDFESAKNG